MITPETVTIRDFFAAQAMSVMLQRCFECEDRENDFHETSMAANYFHDFLAAECYKIADAMLAAREVM